MADQDPDNAREWRQRSKQALKARKAAAGQAAVDGLGKEQPPPPSRRINLLQDRPKPKVWTHQPSADEFLKGATPRKPAPAPGKPGKAFPSEGQAERNQAMKQEASRAGPAYRRTGQFGQAQPKPKVDVRRLTDAAPDAPSPYKAPVDRSAFLDKVRNAGEYTAKPAKPPSTFADGGRRAASVAARNVKWPGRVAGTIAAVGALRSLKDAAADKTGGEGDFDTNVRSAAGKATGISAGPSASERFADQVSEGLGMGKLSRVPRSLLHR